MELVFIPTPGHGHLASAIGIAKLLIDRDNHTSITILIMKSTSETTKKDATHPDQSSRLRLIELPLDSSSIPFTLQFHERTHLLVESHKPNVRNAVSELLKSGTSIDGCVLDMFCTNMIDVANEFNVPTYIYYTAGASSLSLLFHFQTLRDEHNTDVTELCSPDAEFKLPCFALPVPATVLPDIVIDKQGGSKWFLDHFKRFRETKGIFINTFEEMEPRAIESLRDPKLNYPPVYTVGPVLNLEGSAHGKIKESEEIMKWLNDKPEKSVVFLCFGSMGSFADEQVKHIANALDKSGHRFLWSLRRPAPPGTFGPPVECTNLDEILPEGFLERTSERGKIIGWAPQTAVLSHPSVGGFVSHCGWNSTLESSWFGVPMATWPLYAEQQLNAFLLVKELEIAAEIKMDFQMDFTNIEKVIVPAEVIERGIRTLMEAEGDGGETKLGKKVKVLKEKSRLAVSDGGSSYQSLGNLMKDIPNNIS